MATPQEAAPLYHTATTTYACQNRASTPTTNSTTTASLASAQDVAALHGRSPSNPWAVPSDNAANNHDNVSSETAAWQVCG